jgi:hypothetical protein
MFGAALKSVRLAFFATARHRAKRISPHSPDKHAVDSGVNNQEPDVAPPPRKRRRDEPVETSPSERDRAPRSAIINTDRMVLMAIGEFLSVPALSRLRTTCGSLHADFRGVRLDLSRAELSINQWLSMLALTEGWSTGVVQPFTMRLGEAWDVTGFRVDFPVSSRRLRAFLDELRIGPVLQKLHFSVLLDGSLNHIFGLGDIAGLPLLDELVYYVDEDYSQQLGGLHSALSGCISSLAGCPRLQVVDLSYANVHGSIRVFSCMPGLLELRLLQCGNVEGDIASLGELRQLRTLELDGHLIYGSIASLGASTALRELNLNSTRAEGNVLGLSGLTDLAMLDLFGTQVDGNVAGLSGLSRLQVLYLTGTQVDGDVAGLSRLVELTMLDLFGTQVDGSIASLSELKSLQMLAVGFSQVDGDVAEISGLMNLRKLDLVGAKVEGDEVALRAVIPGLSPAKGGGGGYEGEEEATTPGSN